MQALKQSQTERDRAQQGVDHGTSEPSNKASERESDVKPIHGLLQKPGLAQNTITPLRCCFLCDPLVSNARSFVLTLTLYWVDMNSHLGRFRNMTAGDKCQSINPASGALDSSSSS